MNEIILQEKKVTGNTVEYFFSVSKSLERYFKTNVFFIQYDQDINNVPVSILSIPFVNCMAGISWLSGSMLFVDEIDKTYYNSFKQLKHS